MTGKDKGKKGKVLDVLKEKNRVLVEGINMRKKHLRPSKTNQKGMTVDRALSLNASNVMLIDPKGGKQTRVGKKVVGEKKIRIARKSGQEI